MTGVQTCALPIWAQDTASAPSPPQTTAGHSSQNNPSDAHENDQSLMPGRNVTDDAESKLEPDEPTDPMNPTDIPTLSRTDIGEDSTNQADTSPKEPPHVETGSPPSDATMGSRESHASKSSPLPSSNPNMSHARNIGSLADWSRTDNTSLPTDTTVPFSTQLPSDISEI